MVWSSMFRNVFRMLVMWSGITCTINPSSTMELLAVRLAEDFRAPLKTTKLAPVSFRSCEGRE